MIDELNEYDEEIQKIIGIYAPHLGTDLIHETRTTKWRIVAKAVEVAVHPLNLISASGAPRSPVNNCGLGGLSTETNMMPTPSEQAAAVLNIGDVSGIDVSVKKVSREALIKHPPRIKQVKRGYDLFKTRQHAPSERLTQEERQRIPRISFYLSKKGITLQRWELEVLTRGGVVAYDGEIFSFPFVDAWTSFKFSPC